MRPSFQLEIPRRASRCAKGGEEFIPGMDYFSCVTEAENGTFARQDYCPACWKEGEGEVAEGRLYWKSRVPSKKEESASAASRLQHLNRDEKILYLLGEALLSESRESKEEAFVLALYLARRRFLLLRRELVDKGKEQTVNLYEVAATEEMIAVPKIKLSELQIAQVQERVALKLKGV